MEIKIKLKIKDIEIKMSEKDGRELYDFLHRFFGEMHVYSPIVIKEWPQYPYWWSTTTTTPGSPGIINMSKFESSSGNVSAKVG